MDSILKALTNRAAAGGTLDLSRNPQLASAAGLAAANYLSNNLHWSVMLDGPGDGTPGDGSSVTFVVWGGNGSNVNMELHTTAPANITWHWSDGNTDTGVTSVTHTFTNAGTAYHTNYVTVKPPSTVWYFGKQAVGPQGIVGVYGLTNFSSLSNLYLYNDEVKQLNLAGCSSLRQLGLALNPVPPAVCDQWFLDLDAYVAGPVTGDFYYPLASVTATSQTARNSLHAKGFTMHGK